MTTPSVSVVIAVRDGARYLGETLSSILGQTYPIHEVIVVDDGSTDDTVPVARSFGEGVTVVERPALGPAMARNEGIAAATCSVIALCDADDLWLPTKIERQLELIDDLGTPIAVFCGVDEFVSPELDAMVLSVREPHLGLRGVRLSSALVATRAAFDATGPFDASTGVADWLEWSIRMGSAVPATRHHPDVLVRRRLHDRNLSLGHDARTASMTAALAAHLRRKRDGAS